MASPGALSPSANMAEDNPFEAEFNAQYDEPGDDELDFTSSMIDPSNPQANTFAVLNSSLPVQLPENITLLRMFLQNALVGLVVRKNDALERDGILVSGVGVRRWKSCWRFIEH